VTRPCGDDRILGDATSAKADLAIGTRRAVGIVRWDDE